MNFSTLKWRLRGKSKLKVDDRTKKTKILYLFVHLNYGGAEVGLYTTLKNINRDKFDCRVVSIEEKGAVGEEIEKIGFRVVYLNEKARLFNLALIGKIGRILDEEKPDILHTSLFYANFLGRIAAFFTRPKTIITEERSMYTEKRFYHVLIDKILSFFTDKIIVCSNSVLDFTVRQEGISRDKFYLIYNAVDAERFDIKESKDRLRMQYGFSQDDFIVGSVGSLIPKKGHIYLLRSVLSLSADIPNLRVLIIGDGAIRDDLMQSPEALKLKNKIVFLGARRDIPELMKVMDIFVLPSLQEGFPRTLIEAMYSGLPVVASNLSGIPEIVINGQNGFLVPPRDSIAIRDRISDLYNQPELRDKFKTNARRTVETGFMPDYSIKRLEGLYEGLISGN